MATERAPRLDKGSSLLDPTTVLAALKRQRCRKLPTSIALEEATVRELKILATQADVPYQVLMRILILDGIKRLKGLA